MSSLSELGFLKSLEEFSDLFIGIEMDGHRSLSSVAALETNVVFKIFAYYFENLEIFFRKVLSGCVSGLFLRFRHLLDLLFQMADRKVFLDHYVT